MSTVRSPMAVSTTMVKQASSLSALRAAAASSGATPAQMEAYKKDHSDPQYSINGGQLVVNNNPFMQNIKMQSIGDDPEKLAGFYHGIVTSLGNSLEGPGQNAQRDRMLYPTTSENAGLNSRRLYGFGIARQMMYRATLAGTPITLPTAVKTLGRIHVR
jgi:hypothetical protein